MFRIVGEYEGRDDIISADDRQYAKQRGVAEAEEIPELVSGQPEVGLVDKDQQGEQRDEEADPDPDLAGAGRSNPDPPAPRQTRQQFRDCKTQE